MTASAKNLKPGHTLEILDFQGDATTLERMRELGLRTGIRMKFLRQAPFGGPFLFQVSTTLLALRAEELECLKFKSL